METMNIKLPGPLKAFVEERITAGEYGNASDYIRKLIREDKRRKVREELEAKLLESLDSGEPIEVTPEFWEAHRQELQKRLRHKGRKASK